MSPVNSDASRSNKIRCRILWKLSRRHTWGNPIKISDLLDFVSDAADHDEVEPIVEDLKTKWFIRFQEGEGIGIKNNPDAQAAVAFRLRDDCDGYTKLQIETTLSRFNEAGGFDEYTEPPNPPE